MAETSRERVMLSLDPETYAAVKRWSDAAGLPMSTLVGQLLTDARPLIEQMAKAAELAKTNKTEALEALLQPLAEMQAEATQLGLQINGARLTKHPKPGQARKKPVKRMMKTGAKS